MILLDRACVEAELYNLHFCSFIRVGQRTNELSPSTVSLVFIFFWKLLDRRSVLEKGQRWGEGFAWCFGGLVLGWLVVFFPGGAGIGSVFVWMRVRVCVCVRARVPVPRERRPTGY